MSGSMDGHGSAKVRSLDKAATTPSVGITNKIEAESTAKMESEANSKNRRSRARAGAGIHRSIMQFLACR